MGQPLVEELRDHRTFGDFHVVAETAAVVVDVEDLGHGSVVSFLLGVKRNRKQERPSGD